MRFSIRCLTAVVSLAACSSGIETGKLGDYAAQRPHFTVPAPTPPPKGSTSNVGAGAPTHVLADLGSPGYVVLLYVVPGRGATMVYPIDSTTYNYLPAGQHDIPTTFSGTRRLAGSDTLLMRRPPASNRERRNGNGRNQNASIMNRPFATSGYLLMLTSALPLSYAAVAPRVEGVTVPIEDDEALNAIAKQVLSTTDRSKPWSGYYQRIDTRQ